MSALDVLRDDVNQKIIDIGSLLAPELDANYLALANIKKDADTKLRFQAGAMGYSRNNEVLAGGLMASTEDYINKLGALSAKALQDTQQLEITQLQNDTANIIPTEKVRIEREVSLVELDGIRERGEAGLIIEQDIQQIEFNADKTAALTTLDYKEQALNVALEGKLAVSSFNITEDVITEQQILAIELLARDAVTQENLQAKADALSTEFGYLVTAKDIEATARNEASTGIAQARLTAAQRTADARLESAQTKGDAHLNSRRTVSEAELNAAIVKNEARLVASQNEFIAKSSASQLVSNARIGAASTTNAARLSASQNENAARLAANIRKSELDILAINAKRDITNVRIERAYAELLTKLQANAFVNGARISATELKGKARLDATNVISLASLSAYNTKSDNSLRNLNASNNVKILTSQNIQDAKIYDSGRKNTNSEKIQTSLAELDNVLLGDKLESDLRALDIINNAKIDGSELLRETDFKITTEKTNYLVGAAGDEVRARLQVITDKSNADVTIHTKEETARLDNLSDEIDASYSDLLNQTESKLNNLNNVLSNTLFLETGLSEHETNELKSRLISELQASAKKIVADAYAASRRIAADEYAKTRRLNLEQNTTMIKSHADAKLKAKEIENQVLLDRYDDQQRVDIAVANQFQVTVSKTVKVE